MKDKVALAATSVIYILYIYGEVLRTGLLLISTALTCSMGRYSRARLTQICILFMSRKNLLLPFYLRLINYDKNKIWLVNCVGYNTFQKS